MATFEIQAPNGKTYRIEGADQAGALAALQQHLGGSQPAAPQPNVAPHPEVTPEATQQGLGASRRGARSNVTQDPNQPGIMQTLRDNIIGDDDDTTFNTGEKIGRMLNNAGESLTLGVVGDEATAAASAALGGDYNATLDRERNAQEQFRENHPALSFASDVAPAFVPGMGAVKALQAGTNLGRAGAGAAVGVASGATMGFTEGEGDATNRISNAATTAALGGVFGAVAPRMIDEIAGLPRRVRSAMSRSSARPTVGALRATKNAAYQAVDEAGVTFSPEQMTDLSTRVQGIFAESNFDEVADTASGATLRILRGKEGQEQTLGQIDRVRQNLWKRYATANDQPQILDAISEIDSLIDSHPDASGLMDAARAANATFAKSQLLEDAFDRATRQTSVSGSGGNIANNYTRAVNSILNNRRAMRFFNAEEEQAMRSFVAMADEGGPRVRRLIGKMSPNGNGLMMTLHAVGGMASGGATLPLMVAGGVAKNSADNAILRGGEALQDAFAGVGPLTPPNSRLSIPAGGVVSATAPLLENAQSNARSAGSLSRRQSRQR